MRLGRILKIINWSAAAIALGVLILGKEKDLAWIGVVVLAALCLHFVIETAALLRQGRFRRRLADTREFKEHRLFPVKDLAAALDDRALGGDVTIPVIIEGTATGSPVKAAPLSGRKALAWRLDAEPLEGMGKVAGQTLPVDGFWGEISVRDGTDAARLTGPGVLDGSSLVERVLSLKSVRSDLPEIASRIEDGLGIREGKEAKNARIELREIALLPNDKVRVYGKARRSSGVTEISGTDVLDDPESLLVRAAARPASQRIRRRTIQTAGYGILSLVLLAGLVAFTSRTVAQSLFGPGSLFDATRTGKVRLDLDGRQLRISIGDGHWTTTEGDSTRGWTLSGDSADFTAARTAAVKIQAVQPSVFTLRNGDPGYPRWDGEAWVLETGEAPPTTASAGASASGSSGTPMHTGPLYIRNLTGSAVTVRVLRPDGSPLVDTSWGFTAYEAADDPRGHYLELTGKGALQAGSDARVEITTKRGAYRILLLSSVARWGTDSWLLELAPELTAGAGRLYVKNRGDSPVRIWLLGADGNVLYGQDPWVFEPREGADENKGLRLTYDDKDIVMTGREVIRLETQLLTTLSQGTLDSVGSWRRGSWTIDLSKLPR